MDHKKKKVSKKDAVALEELHRVAIARYEASYTAEREERDKCLEDMRFVFVPGSQWESSEAESRKDRPRFEINKIATPVNQAIGDQRQNRIAIKVRAARGASSKEVADVLSGLIRNIETSSHFKDVKDIAFKEIVSGGMGAWCVTTGYADDDSFDQEIKLKSIRSAASSVFYDPAATDELKRDAKWIMVTEDVDTAYFKKRYPNVAVGDLSSAGVSGHLSAWQNRDTIRIADYWVKEPVTVEIALLSDGSVIELTKDVEKVMDEMLERGVTIVKTRKKNTHKIVMYKISAGEVLEGPMDWAGSMIPVVPIFGYNVWINGQHYYQGMVRTAKDPQRVYNYATSQAIEISALSPKDPYWVTPAQMEGHENQMRNFNVTNSPFMFFNPDAKAPGIPQRSGAPSVQQALVMQVQQADMDVQSTTGQYQPSMGMDPGGDKSGRAILALQSRGNASTHELIDNLAKAVEYTGQILIDLIPKIYDTERQVSILGEDGSANSVVLNQTVKDEQTDEDVLLVDLSKGKYDVVSTVGPSFATQRSEGLNFLSKLGESNPLFASLSADLMASSVDFAFAEELTARVRNSMIQQGLVEPNEDELKKLQENEPQQPSPVDILNFKMLQLQVEQQAAMVDNLELINDKVKADTAHKYSQTQKNLTEVIEIKTDINKKLDELGNPIDMPIEELEIAARQKNLQLLNDTLEVTIADINKLPDQMPQPLNGVMDMGGVEE